MRTALDATYVLPLRWRDGSERDDLVSYLRWLSEAIGEVLVVDGSDVDVFEANAGAWGSLVKHVRPDPDLHFLNGKVDGVVTGLRSAAFDRIVIGDDDVRYGWESLERAVALLDDADAVRPQNFFDPAPWYSQWDTARILLNRAFAADYPGTIAVKRGALGPDGYDGDVMFENLELLRTVKARGGRVVSPLDLYVARRPPGVDHFWSQRVRQAYDDFAIPGRMALWLALGPLAAHRMARRDARSLALAALAAVGLAELGRRRAGGASYFPPAAPLFAPLWLAERSVTSWMALRQRLTGGVRYGEKVIPAAANSLRSIRKRQRTR